MSEETKTIKIYAFVDSREDSISGLSELLEKIKTREQNEVKLEKVELFSGSETGREAILNKYKELQEGEQIIVAVRYLDDGFLEELDKEVAESEKKGKKNPIILCYHEKERIDTSREKYPHLDLEKNRLGKREGKEILQPQEPRAKQHYYLIGYKVANEEKELIRNYRQYTLMRQIIERGELSSDFLKDLVNTKKVNPRQKNAVITYMALNEPDMAGGTYKRKDKKSDSDNTIDTMRKRIKINAQTDSHVLIIGAPGTGKEAAAWATHASSSRWAMPFVPINCANLVTTEHAMSILFGHTKGAFWGANSDRGGIIEKIKGGTLFLDQFPKMPAEVQAAMQRFCQSGEFIKFGGNEIEQADVRIIAAGRPEDIYEDDGKSLKMADDLFYILSRAILEIPTLKEMERQCEGTIMKIARILLERYTWTKRPPIKDTKDEDKDIFSPKEIHERQEELTKLKELISGYGWEENNVRELDYFLYQWLIYQDDEVLKEHCDLSDSLENSPEKAMDDFVNAINEEFLPSLSSKATHNDIRSFYAKAIHKKYRCNEKELIEKLRSTKHLIDTYLNTNKPQKTENKPAQRNKKRMSR